MRMCVYIVQSLTFATGIVLAMNILLSRDHLAVITSKHFFLNAEMVVGEHRFNNSGKLIIKRRENSI